MGKVSHFKTYSEAQKFYQEIVSSKISGKKVLIFSPQPWSYLYISKHHYARLLAAENTVYFVTAPILGSKSDATWNRPEPGKNLEVLHFSLGIPERVKFYFPFLYKKFFKNKIRKILKQKGVVPDICIDFGCFSEFDDLDFIDAPRKIFFPVDDKAFLNGDNRGCGLVVSVSQNIVDKYWAAGKQAYFINHGLSEEFASLGNSSLQNLSYSPGRPLRIGFAGNIFSTFMDFDVMERIITEHPGIVFDLFGSMKHDDRNPQHVKWNKFIHESPNIKLWGQVTPADLALEYSKLDGFLLCYKPDYINYHAENSHKILEYLSAGKVLVSTYVSIYKNLGLICMSEKDRNDDLPAMFTAAINELGIWNAEDQLRARILYALDNTYVRQLERINNLLMESYSTV